MPRPLRPVRGGGGKAKDRRGTASRRAGKLGRSRARAPPPLGVIRHGGPVSGRPGGREKHYAHAPRCRHPRPKGPGPGSTRTLGERRWTPQRARGRRPVCRVQRTEHRWGSKRPGGGSVATPEGAGRAAEAEGRAGESPKAPTSSRQTGHVTGRRAKSPHRSVRAGLLSCAISQSSRQWPWNT